MSVYGALTFGVVGVGGSGASIDWRDDGALSLTCWDPSGAPVEFTLTAAQAEEVGSYLAGVLGPIPQPLAAPASAPDEETTESGGGASSAPSPSSPSSTSPSPTSTGDSSA